MSPLVSVCMPVRDAASTLRAALDSMLDQSFRDLDLIVVDDGSRDDSSAILEEYRLRDPRVRILRTEGVGVTGALRLACAETGGQYIARMDADDISLGDRIGRQVAFLEAHPDAAVVGGAYVLIGSDGVRGRTVRPPSSDRGIRRALARYNPIAHSTATMRRTAYEDVGGYRLSRAEDYDLWLRMADRFSLGNLREPVLLRREHSAQVSAVDLEHDVVARLAIAAAAVARREGRPDPLDDAPPSAELLERLGVGQEAVRRALLGAYVSRGAALADVGSVKDAEAMLRRAIELAPGSADRIRAAYAFRMCRSAAAGGKPFEALRLGLGTVARGPRVALGELSRSLWR